MALDPNAAPTCEPNVPGRVGQSVQEDLELSYRESHDKSRQTRTSIAEPETDIKDGKKKASTATDTWPSTTLHGPRLGLVVAAVCLGSLMISLDVTIIATAIPSITSEFGSTSQIAWYPAAFTFATCAITPLAGKMAAVFPIQRVYISFMVLFLVGSILCGCAPSNSSFIAGRAVAGIGSAGIAANGMTILVKVAEPRKKPMLVGLAAGCFAIGLVLAPVIGGVLTARATWRWCFWINIPIAASSIIAVFFILQIHTSPSNGWTERLWKLDLIGSGIFIPSVFMLLFAMQKGGENYAWSSATIIGLFVGSGVMMLLFVVWEWHRGDSAMIPASVVARRTVLFAVLFAFCHMGSLTIATYYLPQWFQTIQGANALDSGVRYLPTAVTQIVMTITASSLAIKLKYYNYWFFLAPCFLVTSSALFTRLTTFSTPTSYWVGFQIIQGVAGGWGMQMSSLVTQLELKDKPDLLPVGIALVSFMQYLGASVVQVCAGAIFNNELLHQLTESVDLTTAEIALLLNAGTRNVRDVTDQNFPQLLDQVLEAYNSAITHAFFVPLAGSALAFVIAFGIKWTKIEGAR